MRKKDCRVPGCLQIQVVGDDGVAIGTHCHVDEREDLDLEKRASDCIKAIQNQLDQRKEKV